MRFPAEDVIMIQALANQVALALHTARTYQAAFEQAITDGLTGSRRIVISWKRWSASGAVQRGPGRNSPSSCSTSTSSRK